MPGGGLPSLARSASLHAAASSRNGGASDRESPRACKLASALSPSPSLLSLFTAVDAGREPQLGIATLRPDTELQSLRGQGGSSASRSDPRLLLFHSDAICLAYALLLLPF